MKIQSCVNNDVLTVFLSGELDESACASAKLVIDACIDRRSCKAVIFDFADLTFMDSSGVGLLIGRFKRLQARGVPVWLARPSSVVDKIFRVSGLYRLMPKIS